MLSERLKSELKDYPDFPKKGIIFKDKVMAAVHVTYGFGKALGFTQINELGTIETPIALTNTLNVFLVANAIVDYMISNNKNIRSVNPVVGETNDGGLNDIQGRHVKKKHVLSALKKAISKGDNPRDIKILLALELTERFSNEDSAQNAKKNFLKKFSKNEIPDNIPEKILKTKEAIPLANILKDIDMVSSTSEALRLINQGAVKIDQKKIESKDYDFGKYFLMSSFLYLK